MALIDERPGKLLKLCTALGFAVSAVSERARRAVSERARRALVSFRPRHPKGVLLSLGHWLSLEESAVVIRTFDMQFVPELLWSPNYARAVMALEGETADVPEEIERRLALAMARQKRLDRPDGPKLWALVDEAALRRPVGGTHVMREQIEHLLRLSKLPNVTLQILPFSYGSSTNVPGPFTLMRFAPPEAPDVVCVKLLANALYLPKQEDTESY